MQFKVCARCKESKPPEYFFRKGSTLQPYCTPCKYAVQKEWRQSPAGRESLKRRRQSGEYRTQHLRSTYGLTEAQYQTMVAEVGGVCEICNTKPRKLLYIDHCHTTGVIRGLLCQLCNQMLGSARDNPDTLRNAIEYLAHRGAPMKRRSA